MLFDFLQKQGASQELSELVMELSRGVEEISRTIIHESTEKAGTQNAFGEEQIAMDVEADAILARYLKNCPYVVAYCSEEMEGMGEGTAGGKYSVFHDPLDGSSLFDVNFSVGTIVGIYEGAKVVGRTPREQVAALYAIYGPRTTLVLSVGRGVHEFLLTPEGWELQAEALVISHGTIDGKPGKIKKYFAPGNLRATAERKDYLELVNWYIQQQYTLRYSGGMVPDIHHMLKKGSGIFMYPGMPSAPDGKLRVLYECGPMAYLVEQAGGASSTGHCSVLDLPISDLTQRTPIFLGTPEEVERVQQFLKQ